MQMPQIPPNCDYFVQYKGHADFATPICEDRGILISLPITEKHENASRWRMLIAAVAEVAWRKEPERLGQGYIGGVDDCEKAMKAEENARLWRQWGEQK